MPGPSLQHALRIYNCLLPLALPVLLPGYVLRARRRGNWRAHFGERLGRYAPEFLEKTDAPIWVRSISVGETFAALTLVRELRRQAPERRVVLSVTTSTGRKVAEDARLDGVDVIYNPVDLPGVAAAALNAIRPAAIVHLDGEVMPNLAAQAHERGIPVMLANARLSARTERRLLKLGGLTAPLYGLLDWVGVPFEEDVARFERIGVAAGRVHHTGSIKFDQTAQPGSARREEFRAVLARLGWRPGQPVLVAGSTWWPEEKHIVETVIALRRQWPGLFPVIVPRHVEHAPRILTALAEIPGWCTARRTAPGDGVADALLVDTTGELRDWFALADVAFIGKSLPSVAEVGGQNCGEPAALGLPVVFGPHMENFREIVAHLLAHDAAIQVPDAPALAPAFARLLASPELRTEIGQRARAVLEPHRGATAKSTAAVIEMAVR